MESQDFTSHHSGASRPSIGFPLGTALLLIILLCLSGFFSCCYHWDKLRSLRRRSSSNDIDPETDSNPSASKSKPMYMNSKQTESQTMPVLMPGDRFPKFIALPCPCEPLRPEKIVIEVQKLEPEPKPLPIIPLPLYL